METPNVDAVPANGAEGTPNPAVSSQGTTPIEGADQVLSTLQSLSAEFKTLKKELGGLQSRQDKAENSFAERLAKLDQYEKSGLSRDQALARMDAEESDINWRKNLETRLSEIAARLENGGTPSNRQQQVAEVFASKGLDLKDPRVAQALVKEYKDEKELRLAAYELREELASSPTPSAAQGASLQGRPAMKASVEELTSKYQTDMLNARGNKSLLIQIKEEARKNGVPVDSIAFV